MSGDKPVKLKGSLEQRTEKSGRFRSPGRKGQTIAWRLDRGSFSTFSNKEILFFEVVDEKKRQLATR